jgi:RecJ-like exonuclease
MGSCIICGTSVEGHICDIHQQDVVFEFEGSRAGQLTPGRFYHGSVDGFADFGVFIDIGDHVTGLLHRSELDRRLESLDWQSGDTVYVEVTGVHDNGNVDLAWSIRQADEEFRGKLIDTPEGEELPETDATEASAEGEAGNVNRAAEGSVGDEPTDTGPSGANAPTGTALERDEPTPGMERESSNETETTDAEMHTGTNADGTAAQTTVTRESETTFEQVAVADLEERVGDAIRIEGEVADLYQTGGPTVFEIHDETGSVECAAFEEAGVRAYPDIEIGDVVGLDGTIERRRGGLQIETEALAVLAEEERGAVEERLDDALSERAEPDSVPVLVEGVGLEARSEECKAAASAIRRAIFDERPIQIKHSASAAGYAAGAALERAILPLVQAEHTRDDAAYHYVSRRPLEDAYDMNEATGDVTRFLGNQERHGEKFPLVVFADIGGTAESKDGFDLLSIYEIPRVVIDAGADPSMEDAVEALVGTATGGDVPISGALAASVALAINPDSEGELGHVPAVSDPAGIEEGSPYAEAAAEAGYGADTVRSIGEALSLIAYYQSYDDKRELVADLLFDREAVADPIAERYREDVALEVDTAEANIEERTIGDVSVTVLDTEAFTHGFDFPPTGLLLDELHRRRIEHSAGSPVLTVGIADDELRYRASGSIDDETVLEVAQGEVEHAGLAARGGSDRRFEFLLGEREAATEALLDALAEDLSN